MYTKHPVLAQLRSVRRREIPSASQSSLQLYNPTENELRDVTFDQALSEISPLFHLTPRSDGSYQITPLRNPTSTELYPIEWDRGGRKNKHFARSGRSKDMCLTTNVTPPRLWQVLSAAYECLLRGARVEFRLGRRSLTNHPSDRNKTIDWALTSAFHLRPDVIMRAMPEGTTTIAQPCFQDGVEHVLMWALENEPALARAGATTPPRIRKMGLWEGFKGSTHSGYQPSIPKESLKVGNDALRSGHR